MKKMNLRDFLAVGHAIPALPLALNPYRKWSEIHQRALIRYYIDAGAGGIAVGVHSTQFEIRCPQHALYGPLLELASDTIDRHPCRNPQGLIKIAGICGTTSQAACEAEQAANLGYHAGLLSLAALRDSSPDALLEHCNTISTILPVIGFYLQPAVGGRVLPYSFWRKFAEIEKVVAIKIAPFNRYQTFDVVRAVIESGRKDLALYTGNDDNIIGDLLTRWEHQGQQCFIAGGLLGQFGVWTRRAVELLEALKADRRNDSLPAHWLSRNAAWTDANAAVFDAANAFAGCIPGIHEILYRQGLLSSIHCLNPNEVLSPGQAEELTRVTQAYPWLVDDEFVRENLDRWLR